MTYWNLVVPTVGALLATLPLASASSHVIMGGLNPIAYERIDPIINPGEVCLTAYSLLTNPTEHSTLCSG